MPLWQRVPYIIDYAKPVFAVMPISWFETGTARDPHHMAVLLGYGATAIYPYLAYASLLDMVRSGEIKDMSFSRLGANYRKGINKGLYKIISKMGISTIAASEAHNCFEVVGLHKDVVDLLLQRYDLSH